MLKKSVYGVMTIFIGIIMAFTLIGCDLGNEEDDPNNPGSGGGSGSGGNTTQDKAISVTVGYSSSHTIGSTGYHYFKFVGTGETFIFETTGNVVDTYMAIFRDGAMLSTTADDNSGAGSNALCTLNTVAGTIYFIRIEARSSTSGTYTLLVKAPTVNIRTNPISVSVGNSSSQTISSSGQHWFIFQGTGNSVIFETDGNVVTTNIELYIGDNTSNILSDKKRICFSTISGQTYYIKITGNSGTYTFNVYNGIGDGSSTSFAIPVTVGYSSSHTINPGVQYQYFSFLGTGNTVIFETTGNIVDTYMAIFRAGAMLSTTADDNSGEGYNARCSLNTTAGTTYFVRIEARSSTSGTYTLVVQ